MSDYLVESPLPHAASVGEDALIVRAAAGDQEAYAALVREHERIAYRAAVAITGSRADAQEAVQNAYVKAYRSLRRFRRGAPFRPWLLRIVVNEAHNVRRVERRHERLVARALERNDRETGGMDDALVGREEAEAILAAIGRLGESDRVVIALRYFAELPDAEAAGLVAMSVGTYRVRLVRARRRLGALLKEADG